MSQHIQNRLAMQLEIAQLKGALVAAQRIIDELKAEVMALAPSQSGMKVREPEEPVPVADGGGP